MDEQARQKYLDTIPEHRRSFIANIFLHAIRGGWYPYPSEKCGPTASATQVQGRLHIDLARRIRDQHIEADRRELLEAVLDDLYEPLTERYICYCIEYERLSLDEKAMLKSKRRVGAMFEGMRERPPSEKQLDYLRSLGCTEIPRDMAHASELIDAALKGR